MKVRLVMESDYEAFLALAQAGAAESEADLGFNVGTFDETFGRMFRDMTCWVCEADDGALVGFLLAVINGFYFTAGLAVSCEVIYVTPAKRGTRAPALLLDEFFRWGDMVGARRKYLGINNGLHPERTARFMGRWGARCVGLSLAAG